MVCVVCSAARLSTPAPSEPLPHLSDSANQLRINQRSEKFSSLRPLALQEGETGGMAPIVLLESLGFYTGRDAWCYNSSEVKLRDNIRRSVDFYNGRMESFKKVGATGNQKEKVAQAKEFAGATPRDFHWRPENHRHMVRGKKYDARSGYLTIGAYRPFFKQRLYLNPDLNSRVRRFSKIYPAHTSENIGISLTGTGLSTPFFALMTNSVTDTQMNGNTSYFPRWCYLPKEEALSSSDVLERVSNINPTALAEYREHYGDQSIVEDDLFFHMYGILHSNGFRETFAADLQKSAPRIPMPDTLDDFRAFACAGRELARLHIEYENIEPFDLDIQISDGWDLDAPDAYRVVKMAYPRKKQESDRTRIRYNAGITLAGIPEDVHKYQVGSRSALDWLIDRYQVSTHDKSDIVNDPNDWAKENGEPRYILDLIRRTVTVSLETNRIVEALPELRFER